jgi:hypothetical protein
MYDQRLSNRENHRQLEAVSAPPAINIRVHRNKGNMPLDFSPGTGIAAMPMVPAPCLTQPLLAKFLNMQTPNHIVAEQRRRTD